MIEVEAPDGSVVEFPDNTPPETIQQVMRQQFPPVEQPGFLERAGGAISGFATGTAKAIVGESDFDLPELTEGLNDLLLDPNLSRSDKDRVGRLTTKLPLARQDQDLEGFVKSEFPNARVFSDSKGNRFARILDKDLALNKAGLSAQDINQVMSEGLILGAGAVPGGRIGQVAGPVGRTLGVAAGIGAGSLAEDELAFRAGAERESRFDLGKAVQLGLLGGTVEAGAIAFNALAPGVRSALSSVFGSQALSRAGKLTSRGRSILSDAGIDPDQVTPEIGQRLEDIVKTTGDEAAAARQAEAQSLPSPVTLTEGQATRDPRTLTRESEGKKGGFGQDVQATLSETQAAQQQALRENIPAIQRQISGRVLPPGQGASLAQQRVIQRRGQAKEQIGPAFQRAREAGNVAVNQRAVPKLSLSLRNAVEDFDLESLPRAQSLLTNFQKIVDDKGLKNLTVNDFEKWRRRARNASSTTDPTEGAAIGKMIRAYDDALDSAIRESLFEGDEVAIEAWKKARALRARFGQVFEQDDIVKTLTAKQRDGSRRLIVTEDEAVNYIFGRGTLGAKRGFNKDLRKLVDVLGEDSQEWREIRAEAFLRLFRRDRGENFPAESFKTELDTALKDSQGAMSILFTPQERATMQQLKRVALNVSRKPNIVGDVNPSGTAQALLTRIERSFGSLGAFARSLGEGLIGSPARRTQARDLIRGATGRLPPRRVDLIPPGVAGTAGATAN